mgnify:CR=1 FL=1
MTQAAVDPEDFEETLSNNSALLGLPGSVSLGIVHWGREPSPFVVLAQVSRGQDLPRLTLEPGAVFQAGEATLQLAGMESRNANHLTITLRLLVNGLQPREPDVDMFEPVELRSYGALTHEQLRAAAGEVGQGFPAYYADWLLRTNGAQPAQPCRLPGREFLLTPERPLLGLHPEYPAFDLVAAQRTWRDPYLTRDQLVIAVPGGAGGLLTVDTTGRPPEWIGWLPPEAMTGMLDPAERARMLVPVASSISDLTASLEAYEPPAGPPAEVIWPGDPRYGATD